MKRALVSIAAGASQLPLLRAARARGLAVIGVDRDPRARGLVECAHHVAASTHDADEVVRALTDFAREHRGLRIEGVVARSSGPPVLTAALVADALGLPGVRPDAAHAAVSKSGQRELARAAGLAVPDARTLAPGGAMETPGSPPWIAKPRVTRVGKAAVRYVERVDRLASAVRQAAEASADGLCDLEAWVPGRDVVVAGAFQGSRWIPCAIFEEDTRFDAAGEAVGWGLAAPAELREVERQTLEDDARAFVRVNRLGDGVLFATFRVAPDRPPVFLEAHLDLGGDYVVDALLAECRMNELALDLATGVPVQGSRRLAGSRVVRFLFTDDAGDALGALTRASSTARVVLDRPAGEGPRGRMGYFVEDTAEPEDNRRWSERVHALLGRGEPEVAR